MRKIIVLEHISLDGVIQAPGRPDEDTSDGFAYGGWAAPYDHDILGAALQKQMKMPFDLLLGRAELTGVGVMPGTVGATELQRLRHSQRNCIEASVSF